MVNFSILSLAWISDDYFKSFLFSSSQGKGPIPERLISAIDPGLKFHQPFLYFTFLCIA